MSWSILPCPQHDHAKSCLLLCHHTIPPFPHGWWKHPGSDSDSNSVSLQVNQSARSSWDTKRAARTGFVRTKHLYKRVWSLMSCPFLASFKILKDQIEEDRNESLSFTSTCCRGGLPLITVYDARLVYTHQPPNSIVPNSPRSPQHVQSFMHIYWLENISYTYTNIKYFINMVQKHLVRPQAIAPSIPTALSFEWQGLVRDQTCSRLTCLPKNLVNLICWPPWKSMPSKSPNGHTNNTNLTITKEQFLFRI